MPPPTPPAPAPAVLTGEQLHQRIIKHLEAEANRTNVTTVQSPGIKSTQAGKPIQIVKCAVCPMVFAMSGHEPGEVDCPVCGTRHQLKPTEPPRR